MKQMEIIFTHGPKAAYKNLLLDNLTLELNLQYFGKSAIQYPLFLNQIPSDVPESLLRIKATMVAYLNL